jgi:hypothetical protein
MKRKVLKKKWTPVYEGPIQGFVKNHLKKNFWRVSSYMDYEDLLQDSYVIFLKLRDRYTTVDDPRWFMSLFMRSFSNHVINLSKKRTLNSLEVLDCEFFTEGEEDFSILSTAVGERDNLGYYETVLSQAPPEIRSALSILINCPTEIWDLIVSGDRNIGNSKLCGLLGLNPKKVNILDKTRNYLGEDLV